MARNQDVGQRPKLDQNQLDPIVSREGFEASVESLIVWANSSSLREELIEEINFPLPEDHLAFLLLNQLVYRGGGRASDLAEAIQTSTSNITKVAKRLEVTGLVTRAPDPEDARGVVLALTEEGHHAGEQIIAWFTAMYDTVFSEWTREEREQFEALAIRFARGIDLASQHAVSKVSGVRWSKDRSS